MLNHTMYNRGGQPPLRGDPAHNNGALPMLSLLSPANISGFFSHFDDPEEDDFVVLSDDYSKIIDLPELALRATFSQDEQA